MSKVTQQRRVGKLVAGELYHNAASNQLELVLVNGTKKTFGVIVTVNGAATGTAVDLDSTTPAAPAGGRNVAWQKDASTPVNISGNIPVGNGSLPGVLLLGAAGGAQPFTPTSQTIGAGATNLTVDVDIAFITSPTAAITVAAVSTLTIGKRTLLVYDQTTSAAVELICNVADAIEGATRVELVGRRVVVELIPEAANKLIVAVHAGDVYALHDYCDLTPAAGAAPYTLTTANGASIVWADTSSNGTLAASTGIVMTCGAINQSYFASSLGAAFSTALAGFVDKWGRTFTADDDFWLLLQEVRSAGTGTPQTNLVLSGAAITATPKVGASNGGAGTLEVNVRVGTTVTATYPSSVWLSASHWLGWSWIGSESRIDGAMLSSAPVGMPGAAAGFWPMTYDAAEYYRGLGEAHAGQLLNKSTMAYVRVSQTVTVAVTSKMTVATVAIVKRIRGVGR